MSQPPAPALSDLIFPQASKTLTTTLTSLKRTNLSISNRLQSIKHDADFVQRVAAAYQLPLVANERCGSWYISPTDKQGSVYFKSTDGHFGQWSLNLRRLNLHLLEVIGSHGGYDYCLYPSVVRRPVLILTAVASSWTQRDEARACPMPCPRPSPFGRRP